MIAAACVFRLKRESRYHIAESGISVWSAWGVSGDQALTVVGFRSLADELNNANLGEGDSLTVHGELMLDTWNKNGQERSGLKLIASKFEQVRPPSRKRSKQPATNNEAAPLDDQIPF